MSKHGMLILAALAALLLAAGPTVAGDDANALAAAADQGLARNLKAVEVSTDSGGHPVVTLSGDGALSYEPQVLEEVIPTPGGGRCSVTPRCSSAGTSYPGCSRIVGWSAWTRARSVNSSLSPMPGRSRRCRAAR